MLRLRGRSVRTALTGLYAAVFIVLAAALLIATASLTVHSTSASPCLASAAADAGGVSPTPGGCGGPSVHVSPQQAQDIAVRQRNSDLRNLFISSAIALAVASVAAVCLSWLMAGRVLRPLAVMTAATRQISASNLHARLAVRGPQDEVKDLADTIDELLGRLESAFAAQRRFVANAAHELSTPLTLERALLEVALADPDASVESLRTACEEVLASNQDQARLIEALLALATGERGLEAWAPVDLAAVTARVWESRQAEALRRGMEMRASLSPAPTAGNGDLLDRLVANLVDNALRYNRDGGWVEVATAEADGRAVLSVRNSGPVVPAEAVERLFLPFQRLERDRTGRGEGHGLGLSIVEAIAKAHAAAITARARPEGGLDVEVEFPAGR